MTEFFDPEDDPHLRITYYKLFIYAALPIVCGFFAITVWFAIAIKQKL